MAHCILDKWLQDQVGHADVKHIRIDANVGCETILETNALNFEVAVQELDLLLQCDLLGSRVLEREAEEVAEARDHLARGFSVLIEQCRDRVECVEKKMWMNLHFQSFQLRLHELRAQFGSLQLAFAETVVVTESVAHSEHDPVNEHPFIEV